MWAINASGALAITSSLAPFPNFSPCPELQFRKGRVQPSKCVLRAQASGQGEQGVSPELRTCRTCKQSYNPLENHPRACRYHSGHFGGETKRKFESVYTGGTLTTVGGGEITQYWHCCGVKDPFDPGCEALPHMSYDD